MNSNEPKESLMGKMMMSCYKVTALHSLSYDKPLSTKEKFQLRTHTMMCSGCRNFVNNSNTLKKMTQIHNSDKAEMPKDKES